MTADPNDGLLGASDLRAIATGLGLRPTKTLGQNFVIDANTVRRIARTADATSDDIVLEVGPGLGSLTLALLPMADSVVAIEVDPALAHALPETVRSRRPDLAHRLSVICADAMTVPGGSLPPVSRLVANLPYNVSVPILLHLLAELSCLRGGLVMVQAEVGERLAAGPGSRVYGAPSAKLAWFADVHVAGTVARSVFWPVPNVDSLLIGFTCHAQPPSTAARAAVFAVIDAAFSQRRKTLRAALATWAGSAAEAESILRACDIDPRRRGESLNVEEFARIAEQAGGGMQPDRLDPGA